jgi:SEC-C motif
VEVLVAIARNAPCPCGSGKKYKQCCLDIDAEKVSQRAAENAILATRRLAAADDFDDLDALSNSAVDFVNARLFDKAEVAVAELQGRYPECIDWLERSAFLHERRGNAKLAADYYRKCLDFTLVRPDDFDEETRVWMREKVAQLDPDSASPSHRESDESSPISELRSRHDRFRLS